MTSEAENLIKEMLRTHVELNERKSVSYLPIKTIQNVLNMTVDEYVSFAKARGNEIAVFDSNSCCIGSGAVYAFRPEFLRIVLNDNAQILSRHRWPTAERAFVEKISSEWMPSDHEVTEVIREAFGDLPA
ncbi:hypothetical protein V1290_002198 [Bradyrhizobium sp. AZCC 1578]|uniref:hypothetical protein n=1 Tax=Bradyrhizobium sp. AZCC 1578 TaxID=3117027 RepID=UPI002FEF805F